MNTQWNIVAHMELDQVTMYTKEQGKDIARGQVLIVLGQLEHGNLGLSMMNVQQTNTAQMEIVFHAENTQIMIVTITMSIGMIIAISVKIKKKNAVAIVVEAGIIIAEMEMYGVAETAMIEAAQVEAVFKH